MPLRFDMPFEQLVSYQGTNPRPDDFDSYWQDALRELDAVDAEVTLTPAAFRTAFADCFHLHYTGVRGARIHALLLRPKTPSNTGTAVLMFHGYSANSGGWVEKLGYVAQGCTVAAMDCRGQGGLSQDIGGHVGSTFRGHIVRGLDGSADNLLYRHIFLDAVQLSRIVAGFPDVDENRVAVTGSSQGGGLALACAALEPRIWRAAPVHPFLIDYKRVWQLDQKPDAYVELSTYFRHHDPLHTREDEVFLKLGYIDIQHLAPRIKAQVLWATGLMDTVCPPSSQFAAYNKLRTTRAVRIYPDFAHEPLPGHADAIFQFITADASAMPEAFVTQLPSDYQQ